MDTKTLIGHPRRRVTYSQMLDSVADRKPSPSSLCRLEGKSRIDVTAECNMQPDIISLCIGEIQRRVWLTERRITLSTQNFAMGLSHHFPSPFQPLLLSPSTSSLGPSLDSVVGPGRVWESSPASSSNAFWGKKRSIFHAHNFFTETVICCGLGNNSAKL